MGECCSPVATCGTANVCTTRKQGLKLVAAQAATKCTGGIASCPATCCEKNTNKCGVGNENYVCPTATNYNRPATESTGGVFVPDLAKSTANCCLTKATCTTYSCDTKKKGLKTVAAKAGDNCASNAASCVEATCCEKNTNKCGVGSPSGLDKLKPLACCRVAVFVVMMAS